MTREEYAECANREDAAAYALAASDVRFPDIRAIHALAAADAHDLAHGVHRIVLDDATVERAARALMYIEGYEWLTKPSEHHHKITRAVLAAAVQEERAMNTDQNLPKEDNSMSNEHSDNCNNPETMCEDCLSTASEDHEAAE